MVLLAILGAILAPPVPPWSVIVPAVVIVTMVALTYFSLYRALIYPTADRVALDGDFLRVTKGGQEALIPVGSVRAIRSRAGLSPEIINLDLAAESEFGRSIAFIPPSRLPSPREHPILAPLRAKLGLVSPRAG